MKNKFLLLLFAVIFLYSCKSAPTHITYLENVEKGNTIANFQLNKLNSERVIGADNILSIVVSTANITDAMVLEQFNLVPLTSEKIGISGNSTSSIESPFQPYIVDKKGYINYPVLGQINVAGLTVTDLRDLLIEKLSAHLSQPVVTIEILNNKVKVMGEVFKPGIYEVIDNSSFSIFDALAAASDITISGDKKHVKLLRENNGEMELAVLDLTSTAIFSSPYYYLKNNDIIIVDPNVIRKKDSTYGMADNYRLSVISTIIGVASLITSTVITIVTINTRK
ncbi:MAG: polysaccharide biosynthesis/export family protein [Candidatus Symbiothrix sp.]|jgi:polysaccharide export outer membrane protein|nr:polysaccharide biosynthesis/export family protein [Candidatus Symbiothrix sp.]